ncbi:hypothetical protein DFQ09_10634 [Winogradskyella pacifica]|uniref:Uncharacterized protein n=1 Tax=Winogradskyella pacifica TaxID=664642 RepID=A0A3D9LQ49_9FLAO|nr:hypothetical protein DFQ09_10634 [Winogradskyella pacifica]
MKNEEVFTIELQIGSHLIVMKIHRQMARFGNTNMCLILT